MLHSRKASPHKKSLHKTNAISNDIYTLRSELNLDNIEWNEIADPIEGGSTGDAKEAT
jgi:hypothetical protein